jgi:hypothetical protein
MMGRSAEDEGHCEGLRSVVSSPNDQKVECRKVNEGFSSSVIRVSCFDHTSQEDEGF